MGMECDAGGTAATHDLHLTPARHAASKGLTDRLLGREARGLNFEPYSDARSLFRYEMHTLPTEVMGSIGTSTLR